MQEQIILALSKTWPFLLAMIAIFVTVIVINWVNKSVGFKFAFTLWRMKTRKLGSNKILLKILVPNGVPEWKIAEIAPRIEYNYKENGKTKQGLVIFNYYCVYEMFAGIKVLECRTDDVFPRNPYVDTSLTISGDVFKKNAVDSSKDDFRDGDAKRWLKMATPILAVLFIGIIIYSQNQTEALAACYAQNAKSAVIVAQTLLFAGMFKKE